MAPPLQARGAGILAASAVLLLAACTSATAAWQDQGPAPKPAPEVPRSIDFGDGARWKQTAPAPFFPGTTYDPAVPTVEELLGRPAGAFTAHHHEVVAGLRRLEATSKRLTVETIGRTHEGRELVVAIIASEANRARLPAIREAIRRLSDPRGLSQADGERLVEDTPAIAWLAYSIHGDEMSGTDASLVVAHHYAAGLSSDVTGVLDEVVVVLDPCMNPDGRERILSMLVQNAGYVGNVDRDGMHRGRWPYGRGNHYLYDMNRDWSFGTQPETRARWAAIRAWMPQLMVDAHEMGAMDTFLVYPATDPFTPTFPAYTRKWWQLYTADLARSFDQQGWSYYTREWADSWYPGYSDSWSTFQGACGILYEQARLVGNAVRRLSGEVVAYRDGVHRQALGSVSNVATLARNRAAALREYLAAKRAALEPSTPGNDRMYVLVPGRHPERERRFVDLLVRQGIEVRQAAAAFKVAQAAAPRAQPAAREFPAGSLVVSPRQPLSAYVQALLEFDPQYDQASLARERKELETKGQPKSYDVTSWTPTLGWDLDGSWCEHLDVAGALVAALSAPEIGVAPAPDVAAPVYGWIVDGQDDSAVRFAAQALELGLQVHLCDEPFRNSGRSFARWSLLVRRHENGSDAAERVAEAARRAGARAHASTGARSPDDGPDLGGRHFDLLSRPRVALLSNTPVDNDSFGHVWHALDFELGLPTTLADAQAFGSLDLRRYDVLIVPDGNLSGWMASRASELRRWIEGGGTLIAMGGAAAAACKPENELTSARLRADALDDLDAHVRAARRGRSAGKVEPDRDVVFGDKEPTEPAAPAKKEGDGETKAEREARLRTYAPSGVILRGEVEQGHWIGAGCRDELPVYFEGANSIHAKDAARTPVRLAEGARLRLGGLLWPEARERLENSSWCVVERVGEGQVILFASPPTFRTWFRGPLRVFMNAVVYGPGAGANPVRD